MAAAAMDSMAAAEADLAAELRQQEEALAGVREALAAQPDPELSEVTAALDCGQTRAPQLVLALRSLLTALPS